MFRIDLWFGVTITEQGSQIFSFSTKASFSKLNVDPWKRGLIQFIHSN